MERGVDHRQKKIMTPNEEVLEDPEVGNFTTACLKVYKYKILHGKKVNQSHYKPEVPRRFQEVKVLRLRDNGPGWW